MRELKYDACVVGGGPAGAIAAFRLANFGHRVCLVEAEAFPRPHVGESLSPGVRPLFELLGLGEILARSCMGPERETLLCWKQPRPERISSDVKRGGLLVDRGEFDLRLLQVAQQAGVRIIQPAHARVKRNSEGWSVETGSGEVVTASFLIDAAGRKGCLPGRRIPYAPRTLALWANLEIDSISAIRIEAVPEGWFWTAPISQRRLSLVFFCDPHFVGRNATQNVEQLLRRTSARTALLSDCVQAPLLGNVQVRDATCAYATEIIGADYVKIGEANYRLDPLSSTGVEKAIQTAMVGAIVVNSLLHHPERADLCERFYRDRQEEALSKHSAWSRGFYGEVERYAGHSFWSARRATPESAGSVAAPLVEAVAALQPATRLRLAPDVSLAEEPCIVDEKIDSRIALRSPALSHPVIFLDGIEVAPLLVTMASSPTCMDLVSHWSKRLPWSRAERLAFWFWEKRILCEAAAA
jgi:flavin-dependent dehydrogenase